MIKVKEFKGNFINPSQGLETEVNEFLTNLTDSQLIDIKYSINSTKNESRALIIYKVE